VAFVKRRKAQIARSWLRKAGAENFEMLPLHSRNCPWNIVWVAGQRSAWAKKITENRKPNRTEPNRTKILVFLVFGFGFSFYRRKFGVRLDVRFHGKTEPKNRRSRTALRERACTREQSDSPTQ
jgi:hypothetical protein